MLLRNPTLLLLFCGQALYWSCSLIGITLTSLVGVQLAPLNSLATLPWPCWCWATCWRCSRCRTSCSATADVPG